MMQRKPAASQIGERPDPIDTLAMAYAQTGDFDSAVRFEERAAHAGDANEMSEILKEHLAMFKQHRPVR